MHRPMRRADPPVAVRERPLPYGLGEYRKLLLPDRAPSLPRPPSNRYQEIAPKVEELFERYGLTYTPGPRCEKCPAVWKRLKTAGHVELTGKRNYLVINRRPEDRDDSRPRSLNR